MLYRKLIVEKIKKNNILRKIILTQKYLLEISKIWHKNPRKEIFCQVFFETVNCRFFIWQREYLLTFEPICCTQFKKQEIHKLNLKKNLFFYLKHNM